MLYTVVQIFGWIEFAGVVVWGALDIADRRGNWAWMIAFVCCGVIGLPIYMLAGRKR
jgi:hypothetical protein